MRRLKRAAALAAFLVVACARSSAPRSPEPAPVPVEPSAIPTRPTTTRWSFEPAQRSTTYRSTTVSTVRSKSAPERSQSTEITSTFTINVDQTRSPFLFSGLVSRLGDNSRNAVPITLPFSFSGTADSLRVESASSDSLCNPSADLALGEMRSVIANWPLRLASNSAWSDSLTSRTCALGGVPLLAKRLSNYRVAGTTDFNGIPAIVVSRNETIDLEGQGANGQHQLHIAGVGKGTSTIYVDTQSGLPLAVDAQEELNIVLLSGRRQEFVQTLRQKIQRN